MTDNNKVLSDGEAKLFALTLDVVKTWADLWLSVYEGQRTREEAFEEFNTYLRPIGEVVALAMVLPGIGQQISEVLAAAEGKTPDFL
jgi:hypothetical protein